MSATQEQLLSYKEYLEMLKIEMGEFLRFAEAGKTIRHAALKSRKQSIKLRNLLKSYRTVSLDNDIKISQIISEAKNKIKKEAEV